MPQYEIRLHTTAERELDDLADGLRDRLVTELAAVAREREPTSHASVRALEGHTDLFRVRAGEARAICSLSKPSILVIKVGPRGTVYDGVDSVDERLADAV